MPGPEPTGGAALWRLRLEVDEPDAVLVTASSVQAVEPEQVGFASAGPAAGDRSRWELYAIGVAAPLRGSGVADDLLRAAVGSRPCEVWVETSNARARSFYGRHGFAVDGAERLHEGGGPAELRMSR